MKISAQVLVENEENFVWYSVMSVLPYVDEVRIVDAGSKDNTFQILQIIKKKFPNKVVLSKINKLTPEKYPEERQKMLKDTSCDWILVVDGDEVWWTDSIQALVAKIKVDGNNLDSIVTPFINCVPDMYHIQPESAGKYKIDSKQGHLTIHAINTRVNRLSVKDRYGIEGYFSNHVPIQELKPQRRFHFSKPCFMHLTHLKRTSIHSNKVKRELGVSLPLDFYYPEVFFRPRPEIVKNPWIIPTLKEQTQNVMLGMPRIAKRWML